MSSRKRTSLDAVLGAGADIKEKSDADQAPAPVKPKRQTKQKSMIMSMEVFQQLRLLAFEEDRPMNDYILEGLDRVFADRGLPSVSALSSKDV